MNINNIKTVFEDYLKADKTQYAILLNGTWGSGKTFFWKYNLEQIAISKKFKTIYISLNGVSKIDALEQLLFIKLLPFISDQENTKTKNVTTILTNIINYASKTFAKVSLTDITKGLSVDFFDFSKYVICFDDLERCQIPVKEVLGFINNYVEHKNLKTIILADETNITITQEGYDNIKEKVIGRVLNFELNIEETIPQLFKKYEKDKANFYTFLIKQRQTLIDLLIEYKQNNLRIIVFYLDILEKIFPCFKDIDEKYVQELIFFSAIITFEFKKGHLTSSEYKNPKGIDTIDDVYFIYNLLEINSKSKNSNTILEKSYAEIFYEIYIKDRDKNYFYYPSVFSYILSGYIDLAQLEKEIKSRVPEVLPQKVQDFNKLLTHEFREFTDEEFIKLVTNVLVFAKQGEYTIYDYVHIARFFYFFSNEKLINESVEEITTILVDGLTIAKNKKEINDATIENILRFGSQEKEIAIIERMVKGIHEDIKKEQNAENNKELIDYLLNKNEQDLYALFDKNKLLYKFFQYIDNQLLFNAIIKTTNKKLFRFVQLLHGRYNSSNIGDFLYEDRECLKILLNDLEEYLLIDSNIQKLRKFNLLSLRKALEEICTKLEESKSK